MPSKRLKTWMFRLFGLVALPGACLAFQFRLDGDRLWLQAENTPLVDILGQFARAGVEVRLDPRIRSAVTGAVRGEELGQALDSLLEPYDYLLTWKVLRGPLGRVPKLEEIQVFLPGGKAAARPIPEKTATFDATRGVLGSSPEFVKDELLLAVRPGTTYAQFRRLLDEIGGMIVDADSTTGVYLLRFPPGTNVEALLRQLASNPLVAHAELNYVARLPRASASPSSAPPLPLVRPPADGSVPVAVLDSGLDPAAGLAGLVSAGWDAVDPDRALADGDGHGTQMAWLASGVLSAEGAVAGDPLPLVSIRAFDEEGRTSHFAILQALAFAAQAGARVVNMSWGSSTDSDFLRAAMQSTAARGLLLVAAAGNEPTGAPVYPAAYPEVLAVAGVAGDGQAWASSNRGEFVDLSAPAFAAFPAAGSSAGGAYAGTSISSAVVANALAQYLNRHSGATADATLAALRESLSPSPAGGFGAGVLAAAALARFLAR